MSNSFKYTFPTFDTEQEFHEVILDVPSTNPNGIEDSEKNDYKFMTATVNEITTSIVSQMMLVVKHDLSGLAKASK